MASPMSRRGFDVRFSSPAVERARAKAEERERARHQGDTGRHHGDRVDLAVLVDELDSGPVEVREDLPAEWVSALVDDRHDITWSGEGDGRVDVTLEREAAFVRLKGKARFSLLHPCVRCGQRDVPFEVPLKLDLRLVERQETTAPEGDFESFNDGDDHAGHPLGDAADLEDIDVASYAGHTVALDAVLREQLFLELPAHPNCESAGACLKGPCGLLEQQAALQAEKDRFIDPRWAGLLALKDKLGDGATAKATPAPHALLAPATSTPPTTTAASQAPTKKATTKKPAKKATTKKPAKKATTKKATTKKPAKKATTKKPAKKATTKKPAKKATTKKPAKKAATKKATTKKAPTKKPMKKTAKARSSTKGRRRSSATAS
jgi:uncharacterized metal-binding protein YceD (DUF177 family)